MKNQNSAKIFGVVVVVLIIAIAGLAFWKKGGTTAEPGKYDALAQCFNHKLLEFFVGCSDPQNFFEACQTRIGLGQTIFSHGHHTIFTGRLFNFKLSDMSHDEILNVRC